MLIVLQHTTARKLHGALGYAVRQSFLDPQKSGLDFMDSGSEPIGTLSILSLVAGRIQRAANKLNTTRNNSRKVHMDVNYIGVSNGKPRESMGRKASDLTPVMPGR